MKKTVSFIFILVFVCNLSAQVLNVSNVSPEFLHYMQLPDSLKGNYVPSPVNYSIFSSSTKLKTTYPESYDLRDNISILTPRQQGSGACWAYANMDALQATFSKLGLTAQYYSPKHLLTCDNFIPSVTAGGTSDMAIAYCADGKGPVYETAVPSSDMSDTSCVEVSDDNRPAFLGGAIHVNYSVDAIKQMIYNYGGVEVGVNAAATMSKNTYSSTYNSLYVSAEDSVSNGYIINHAATIVGWDDNYSSFNSSNAPSSNGAWIVKGTYGTSYYNNGYYYASYYSHSFGDYPTAYTKIIPKSYVDTVYQYDEFGSTKKVGSSSVDSLFLCAVYNAPSEQKINYLGTYVVCSGEILSYYIINSSNSLLFSKTDTVCPYPGYYTFPVNADVSGSFSVIFKYKTPDGKTDYPAPVESSVSGYCTNNPIGKNQYYSISGNSWTSLPSAYNVCIKAYAKKVVETIDNSSFVVSPSIIVKDFGNIIIENASCVKQVALISLDGDVVCWKSNSCKNKLNIYSNSKGIYILRLYMSNGSLLSQKIIIK